MLKYLGVSNLAVIDRIDLELGAGLNVLTGETGSGKSLILQSLGLLLGARASQELIRTGAAKAYVEGVFEVGENSPLQGVLAESGVELDGSEVVIKRELLANGRGKVLVNHHPVTLPLLKLIQPLLIDVHGQGEQQSLVTRASQLDLLDNFAETGGSRDRVAASYGEISAALAEIKAAERSESERLQALDLIEYQLSEIETAQVRLNEDAELESERKLLANAERAATLCDESVQALYEDEGAVLPRLGWVRKRLTDLKAINDTFNSLDEQLETAKCLLEDVAFSIRDFAEKIDFTPDRLQIVEERLVALDRLKRKYGGTLAGVLDHRDQLRRRREAITNHDLRLGELKGRLRDGWQLYQAEAGRLQTARRAAARKLERLVAGKLKNVSLSRARFLIDFRKSAAGLEVAPELLGLAPGDAAPAIDKQGLEVPDFLFSANEGEEVRPLGNVISGGELSRLMLILKSVVAPTPYPRSLVFDEIDAGIGGREADLVGSQLKRLAASNQVICITHQAQIARYADAHLRVRKSFKDGRTASTVDALKGEERVQELARMIGGSKITSLTLKHAEELLTR